MIDLKKLSTWSRKLEWDELKQSYSMRKIDGIWHGFYQDQDLGGGPKQDDALDACLSHRAQS